MRTGEKEQKKMSHNGYNRIIYVQNKIAKGTTTTTKWNSKCLKP